MKLFCLLLFVSSALCNPLFTAEEQTKIDQWRDECMKENNLTLEEVTNIYGKPRNDVDSNDNLNNFSLCFLRKIGWADEHGDALVEVIKPKIEHVVHDRSKTEEVVKKCVVNKDNPGAKTHELILCLRRELNSYLKSA